MSERSCHDKAVMHLSSCVFVFLSAAVILKNEININKIYAKINKKIKAGSSC